VPDTRDSRRVTFPAAVVPHDRTGSAPDTISLLVVDRAGIVSDDVWSMSAVRRDLRVVARMATAGSLRSVIERRRPHVTAVTWSGADDDPEVVAEASRRTRVVVIGILDAQIAAHALRAGARGVVSVATCSASELATAARTVLGGGGHLSPDVAGVLAAGFHDRQLAVAGGDVDRLTRREREVMRLVADAWTNPEIAATLDVSRKTVKNHLTNVYAKLGVNQRAEAVAIWRRASSTDA
jgi:DNA-binding NarL/FixJ family response regulator